MRPDWTKPLRDPTNLIDLSTNICYDQYVEEEISLFLRTSNLSVNDVANELPLYDAISKYHQNIPLKNITLGFGLGELYNRIVNIFQFHHFAIHVPTWEFAYVACQIHNANHTLIKDIYKSNIGSILYVANPSGVTGKAINKYTIQNIAKKYQLVIVDESYGEYTTINSSLIDSINTHNIIVLKSLSKSLGTAGLRVGYALANEEITTLLQEKRPSSVTTSLAVALAPKLFNLIPSHIKRMIAAREWLIEQYSLSPSNGNYVLFDDLPDNIQTKFKVREINNQYRLSLTNLERIQNALGD